MADTNTQMLQTLIDGQKGIQNVLNERIDKLEKQIVDVKREVVKNRERIDKFGYELAELSGDAPTTEEYDELEERVEKLEKDFDSFKENYVSV